MKRLNNKIIRILILGLLGLLLAVLVYSCRSKDNDSQFIEDAEVGQTSASQVVITGEKTGGSAQSAGTVETGGSEQTAGTVVPGGSAQSADSSQAYASVDAEERAGLILHMLDVGQGDSALIEVNGRTILIDTGEEKYRKELFEQLDHFEIKKIDTLILSHNDSDHIGSSEFIIEACGVENVYMVDYPMSTYEYQELSTALSEKKITPVYVKKGDCIDLGPGAEARVLSAGVGDSSNASSMVIKLSYYDNKFLFTGDAPAEVENQVLWENDLSDIDVLKVAHHGSAYSSPIMYLKQMSPKYALISVGAGNSYGHPTELVLKRLVTFAEYTLRTDLDGTITVVSDGKNLTHYTEKLVDTAVIVPEDTGSGYAPDRSNLDDKSGSDSGSGISNEKIIGNVKSKVYHTPYCKSPPAEKNRVYFGSDEEAEAEGYRPCQNCH